MDTKLLKSLETLIIPTNSLWSIKDISVDSILCEVNVTMTFTQDYYKVKGKKQKIYDHRPSRKWRHLDFWQYKTFIRAEVPRVKTDTGIISIPVPWAEVNERMTELLEKKL